MDELINGAKVVLDAMGSALGWTLDTTGDAAGIAGQGQLSQGALGF